MVKLGQILVRRGWITTDQLEQALTVQAKAPGRLGTCLVDLGLLSEEKLLEALSEQLGVPAARVEELKAIPEEVRRLLPPRLAVRCRAVPLKVLNGQVHVAMMDTRDLGALDEIAFALGKRVQALVGNEIRILEALDKHYGHEAPSRIVHLLDRLNRSRYLWHKEPEDDEEGSEEQDALWATAEEFHLPEPPAPKPLRPAGLRHPPGPSGAAAVARLASLAVPDLRAGLPSLDDREEIGRTLLTVLAEDFGLTRIVLLKVHRGQIAGWMGLGADLDQARLGRLSQDFRRPSVLLKLRQGLEVYHGPLPPMPVHQELARCWGGELPRECVMVPIRVQDRLVTVIYADRGSRSLADLNLKELLAVARDAGRGFETCILSKKGNSP